MQAFDPTTIMVGSAHFIGGVLIAGGSTTMEVARLSDGQFHAVLPIADAAVVDRAVTDAARFFRSSGWATRAPRDRAKVLLRWANLVENDTGLAALEAVCSTRPITDATGWDVPYTAECICFFAEWADKAGGEVAATRSDALGLIIAEPYGVVAAIAPWNFPLVMAAWKLAPALAAGNAVILKPSEMTPFSVVRLAELAIEAGMPPGIFNVVQGDGRTTGDALCRHPGIGKITFTGSTKRGAAIMAASAGTGIRPIALELGGKSPQVVFADAPDLDRVSATVSQAITGNAGQVCVAGSCLIVQKEVAEQIVDGIARRMAALRPGPTWRTDTSLSPIISDA